MCEAIIMSFTIINVLRGWKQWGRGVVEDISEKNLEFLVFSLQSWKFQAKQSFILGSSTKWCYILWTDIPKPKSKTHHATESWAWNFHIYYLAVYMIWVGLGLWLGLSRVYSS